MRRAAAPCPMSISATGSQPAARWSTRFASTRSRLSAPRAGPAWSCRKKRCRSGGLGMTGGREVTVAATQFACGRDPAANVDKAEQLVRRAAADGADIILLQELFETPYFCKDQRPDLFALARPASEHPTLAHMAGLARELGV